MQLVKCASWKFVGSSIPTPDVLWTLIREAEAVVSTHPLVYLGEELEWKNVLTPAHFLSLNPKLGIPGAESDLNCDSTYSPEMFSTEYVINN